MPPQQPNTTPVATVTPPQSPAPLSAPKQMSSFWVLVGSAVAIATVLGIGIRTTTSAPVSLPALFSNPAMLEYAVYLLPSIVLSIVLIIVTWLWGRSIHRKEHRPILGFFFGTGLYLLTVLVVLGAANVLLTGYTHTVSSDISYAVVLVFSIFFLASIQILYGGLIISMALLIAAARSVPQGLPVVRSPLVSKFRYAVIGAAVLLALYACGAVSVVASATHQQWLCNFVYSGRAKASCFLATAATTASQSAPGSFVVVKTDYKQIKDLHDVGGKLAYAYENDDGTSGVVYDGQVVSGAYQKVGILPVAEVGGTLAYEAYKNGKQIIVWNGQEYGENYDMALQPTDVGGKLAYLAQIGTVRPDIKQLVVWDGKEYGSEFDQTNDIRDIGGALAYHGKKGSDEYIVIGGKRYGPYGWVNWLQEKDGHAVAMVRNGSASYYVVDGALVGGGYAQLTDLYAFVDGKFAFSAIKDGKAVVVYDGKEINTGGSSYEVGPYVVNGQLAYVATNNGTTQLMVGGQPTGPVISGSVRNVDVSKGGRVAIQVDDGTKECGSIVHGPIYLDGKEVYSGCSSNPFGFFGEKLLFWMQENKLSTLWYDGKEIGQGFYGFNYFAVVNGKLSVAAFASGLGGRSVQYSLLLEQ